MTQKKLPLINSAHGSETRNIINELIKLFNGMGYTYNESLQKAHDILDEAQRESNKILDEAERVNALNENVQQQINTLIAESGTSDAEVLQARIDAEGNEYAILKERLDIKERNFSSQLSRNFDLAKSTKRNHKLRSPVIALIDDDGHHQVFNKLKPMLDDRGLKGTFSLATSYINTSGFLSENQIYEMIEDGHEMVNHAHTNPRLANLTENEIRFEFEESQRILKDMGIITDVHVYPNGSYNDTVVNILKDYFNVAVDDQSGRNSYPLSTFSIKRVGIGPWGSDNFDDIKSLIDAGVENKELIVLMTHIGQHNAEQDELLENILDYILTLDVDFKTFSDAYKGHENILDHGVFVDSLDNTAFNISVDGDVGGYSVINKKLEDNAVTSETQPSGFDIEKITYTYISFSNRHGFPTNQQGLLVTNTLGFRTTTLNIFQEYHTSQNNIVYRRYATGLTSWGNWMPLNMSVTFNDDEVVLSDLPNTFPQQSISYCRISNLDGFDFNTRSLLITNTIGTSSLTINTFQELHVGASNKIYRRFATGLVTWGQWQQLTFKDRYEYSMNENVQGNTTLDVVTTVSGLNYEDTVIAMPVFRMTSNVMYNHFIDGNGVVNIRLFNMTANDINVDKDWIIDVIKN